MQWREVDDKVANRCVISFSGNSPLFEYSRAHNLYAPVIIRRIEGSLFLTLSISGSVPISNSTGFFLRKFNAEEEGGSWYVKYPVESFDENKIIEQINEMPSVIMGYLYLKNGRFFADFRFHRSMSLEISSLLMNYLEKNGESAIESIVSNSGEIPFLKEMNALIPLSLITYSIPTVNDDPLEKCLSVNQGIGQGAKKAGTRYRALIYMNSPPIETDGVRTISEEDRIYGAEGNNPLLQQIRDLGNDSVVFRASHFMRVIRERLLISVFLPSYQTTDFLRVLEKVRLETKESVTLYRVQPFQPELFEFI
ncbi:MAG: hypothetical protein ACYCT2_07255 [Thermoplasmataceae archaeon]